MIAIDGYDNFELLGQGGMAVVYRARQVSVGRDVAIKVLGAPAPDADLVRRFERESKAVGALSWHPHIAAVVDAGTTNAGQAYIVFELLSGGSLESRLAEGSLPWQEAVPLMIQIADAVEAAHRAEVLHRDVKPGNILVSRLGDAKLADFGIASMQDGNKTETGMLATTVAHAAPELFDGMPASVATDVYALGSTLHNLVTGHPPFGPAPGERIAAAISRIAHEAPPRPDAEQAPTAVANVIAHAMAKQPEHRLRSAADFGRALQQAQRSLGLMPTAMPISDTDPAAAGPFALPSGDHIWARESAPLSKTIGVLSGLVAVAAAVLAYVLLSGIASDTSPIAVTAGGIEIASIDALTDTAMEAFPPLQAIDGDATTAWGIQTNEEAERGIVGTTYVLRLKGEQTIKQVGVVNTDDSELGRIAAVNWAMSIDDLIADDPSVLTQLIPNEPGDHLVNNSITTDVLVVQIHALHDPEATTAGLGELLIVAR